MKTKRFLALLLSVVVVLGMMSLAAFAYYEAPFFDGDSVDVCTEGKTYSLFAENDLEGQNGTTFLYVVKSGDRYYTLGNPRYSEFNEVDSVYAVDITEYYDAQTNTFSGISDNVNVGAMQYQMNAGSYMYVDGDMLFALSVPFESEGQTWFDGGIRYYSPEETYSYSRPLWHSNGDGSGYLYDSYIDWFGDSDTWVYGVLDLKYTGTNYVFALRDKSEEYNEVRNADPDNYDVGVNVKAYLYAAPCGHEQNVHGDADAPTCMEKGCEECWYCRLCGTYFKNKEMTEAYAGFPEISALGHNFDSEKCKNCKRPVPVYSKVTNKTDFFALADDTMYVLVAEYEGKYYTPDSSVLYSYVFDLDGDGYRDIYNVDENDNGTPDIAEIDYDENGVFDLWDYPTEEERLEYFDSICQGYLTDMLYGQTVGIPVKEITLNYDGTISHDAVKDALEFEMIKLHSEEDNPDYTLECVMQFVVPNTFINSPAFIPEDRPYDKQYPDEGDTYYWAVLFYNDRDSYYTYDWENDEYVSGLPFLDICKEGSIALSKSWNAFSPEFGEQLGCLRLRDYNGELRFVVGSDYNLEGSEWVDDENGGYYDAHDTQACVYLYASEGGATCDHEMHESTAEPPTCTDPGIRYHFYCTKCEKYFRDQDGTVELSENDLVTEGALGHDWGEWTVIDGELTVEQRICKRDTDHIEERDHVHDWDAWQTDGADHHNHTCQNPTCGKTETDSHEWGRWISDGEINHTNECQICHAIRTEVHDWDAGVITQAPSEDDVGIKIYTCVSCLEEKTEYLDRLEHTHVWSDWIALDNENHVSSCVCGEIQSDVHHFGDGEVLQAPSHTVVGQIKYVCANCYYEIIVDMPAMPDHEWSEWESLGSEYHGRTCECGKSESEEHIFVDGRCECGEEDPNYVPPHEHEWSEWKENGNGAHSRYCNCGENETLDHNFDNGETVREASHTESGLIVYTCAVCSAIREEIIEKTAEHSFSEWHNDATVVGTHIRECACGETEVADCSWDVGTVTSAPTYDAKGTKTFTCTVCGATRAEAIEMLVMVEEIVSADNTGVKISTPEGSTAVLNENTEVHVDTVTENVTEQTKEKIEIIGGKNAEVLASYDISLLLDGVSVQPGGAVEVTLPIPEATSEYGALIVVYIDDNGNVTPCETRINADGTITFVTDHFSHYSIIGVPNTSATVWILISSISVVLIGGAVAALLIISQKKGIPIAQFFKKAEKAENADGDSEKENEE